MSNIFVTQLCMQIFCHVDYSDMPCYSIRSGFAHECWQPLISHNSGQPTGTLDNIFFRKEEKEKTSHSFFKS